MIKSLLTAALLSFASLAHAKEADWQWFKMTSAAQSWSHQTGIAHVRIDPEQVTADLYVGDSDSDVEIKINGKIRNKTGKYRNEIYSMSASVLTVGSDLDTTTMTGTYRRFNFKKDQMASFGLGREIIILTNGFDSIGIMRQYQ